MDCALDAMRARVSENGKLSAGKIETEQHAVHGLAWLATYVEAIKEMAAYARRMQEEGRFGETEQLLTRIGLGEYLDQIFSAIPMNQSEMVRLADFGLAPDEIAPFRNEAVEALIGSGQHARKPRRPRRFDRRRRGKARSATPASTRPSRRSAARCAASPTPRSSPHAQGWHRANAYIPLEIIAGLERHGRLRPHHPRGLWRHGARQGGDVRRVGGTVARLYRRGFARHPLRDRRRAHPRRRHGSAEAEIPAPDRERRDPADRRLHRAQHRLRPRVLAHPRDPRRRRLRRQRGQDLDHPSRARRSDDAARPHQSGRARLSGPVDVPGREAARDRRRSVSRPRACRAAKSKCSAIAA